jgi:hypothetical protein
MKRAILFFTLSLFAFGTVLAQEEKVDEVTAQQKLMKAKEFREDNQKYLKSLGMDEDQMIDIDNVNSCHSFTLERISHYATDKGTQKKHLEMAKTNHRAQLDLIMGAKNREKYEKYVTEKVRKMQASMQAGKQ